MYVNLFLHFVLIVCNNYEWQVWFSDRQLKIAFRVSFI